MYHTWIMLILLFVEKKQFSTAQQVKLNAVFTALNKEKNKVIFSHLVVFQVSLVLEPLPELYGTSSSVPITEGSLDAAAAQGSSKSQVPVPSQQPRHTRVTFEQESVDNGKATTPRYLLFSL